jgi:hypothetical protein
MARREKKREGEKEMAVYRKWRSCGQTVGNGKASCLLFMSSLSLAKEERVPTVHVQMSLFLFFLHEGFVSLCRCGRQIPSGRAASLQHHPPQAPHPASSQPLLALREGRKSGRARYQRKLC